MYDEAPDQVCIRLSRSSGTTGKPDYASLTPAGETYNELARWLLGREWWPNGWSNRPPKDNDGPLAYP